MSTRDPAAPPETLGLLVEAAPGPGVLHELSGVLALHRADVTLVAILDSGAQESRTYFEARVPALAGALMGGDIGKAVREIRGQGLLVISLNMAGSVPEAADLVVTDPVQAGVMAVMAIADTAKFRLDRLNRRSF